MKKELPHIEKQWRKFRQDNGEHLNYLVSLFKRSIPKLHSYAKLTNCSLEQFKESLHYTALPYLDCFHILQSQEFAESDLTAAEINDLTPRPEMIVRAQTLSFFANYRASKTIWNIDKDFVSAIKDIPFPDNTPASALRFLPSNCICIPLNILESFAEPFNSGVLTSKEEELSSIYKDSTMIVIWYDWKVEDDRNEPTVTLRIGSFLQGPMQYLSHGNVASFIGINVSDDIKLEDALDEGLKEFSLDNVRDKFREAFRMLLNILLYAAGCDDVVKIVGHEYPSVKKEKLRKEKDIKIAKKELSDPNEYDIGVQFGNAIRRYKEHVKVQAVDSLPTGRTVRPHIRRAHSHLYWSGEDRKIPRVHFLAPVAVNMEEDNSWERKAVTLHKLA